MLVAGWELLERCIALLSVWGQGNDDLGASAGRGATSEAQSIKNGRGVSFVDRLGFLVELGQINIIFTGGVLKHRAIFQCTHAPVCHVSQPIERGNVSTVYAMIGKEITIH